MKNYKGGYKLISLNSVSLVTKTTATVNGIYHDIESNYNKPLMFCDIVLGGVERPNVYASVTVNNDKFVVSLYGLTLTISSDNKISVA